IPLMASKSRVALLAIDQGTTSTRVILFSDSGELLFVRQKELTLLCPQKGWVEQDPEAIWNDTLQISREVIRDAQRADLTIVAIGIANQRETTLIWDRKTGRPVYNAIVWQDRRTTEDCEKLKNAGH